MFRQKLTCWSGIKRKKKKISLWTQKQTFLYIYNPLYCTVHTYTSSVSCQENYYSVAKKQTTKQNKEQQQQKTNQDSTLSSNIHLWLQWLMFCKHCTFHFDFIADKISEFWPTSNKPLPLYMYSVSPCCTMANHFPFPCCWEHLNLQQSVRIWGKRLPKLGQQTFGRQWFIWNIFHSTCMTRMSSKIFCTEEWFLAKPKPSYFLSLPLAFSDGWRMPCGRSSWDTW